MAAGGVQRLYLKDLDAVLAQAKTERWANLAILEWDEIDHHAVWLTKNGFRPEEVLLLYEKMPYVPAALLDIGSLVALSITGQGIGDAGADALASLRNLTFLYLPRNEIGDAGAEAVAQLSDLTTLHLGSNKIGPSGAVALAKLEHLTSLALGGNRIGDAGVEAISGLRDLTTLNLSHNQIGDAELSAIGNLQSLRTLDLGRNKIGNTGAESLIQLQRLTSLRLDHNLIDSAGAEAIALLHGLTSLVIGGNRIGDAGAKAITNLMGITRLHLDDNEIGDLGAQALAHLHGLDSLGLGRNHIGDSGARAIALLQGLTALHLTNNQIGEGGGRAILDAWAEPETSDRRLRLSLLGNDGLAELLPEEVLRNSDAQVIIAAWRQRKELEAGRAPLPKPEEVGKPVSHGVQVGTAADGRLMLVDPMAGSGARDDEIGRELHQEVIAALDRLISVAGRSNVVAEWREAAAAAKERLGTRPSEVRVSAILRIERLRSLREADERRRSDPDPLGEPAEVGIAAALRDAVAAVNLYVATDPFLAERQNQIIDPRIQPVLSIEEAAAAEADLEAVGIADEALLDELRFARETARMEGEAGRQARVWLDGSWRNATVEMLRKALAWIHLQADHAAMHVRLGAAITIDDAASMLVSMRLLGQRSASALSNTSAKGVRLSARTFVVSATTLSTGTILHGLFAWLENQFEIVSKLGFPPEFVFGVHKLLLLAG